MIEFVAASPGHVGRIASGLRAIDALECAIFGHEPKQALRLSLMSSDMAWTAKKDGAPIAMWGVCCVSFLGGVGSPWMLMTDEGERHARALLVDGMRYTLAMQERFPVLRNKVHADNHTSIRWLSRLGYQIGEIELYRGHPMREFERTR